MKNKSAILYDFLPPSFHNILISLYGMNLKFKRYNNPIFRTKYEILMKQNLQFEENLEDYYVFKLKHIIQHAYDTIPFYNNLLKKIGFNIDDFNSLKDFKKLPIINKHDIINDFDRCISEDYPKTKLIKQHTSGTTGTAFNFCWTINSLAEEFAFVYARRRDGVKFGEYHATFNSRELVSKGQRKPPFWRHDYSMNNVLFSQYHLTQENLKHYVEFISNQDFKYFQGYPSFIYIIANYIYENNIRLKYAPKYVYTSSETLYEWQKEIIEKVFKCKVLDSYGLGEQVALLTQCEFGNYHIVPEYGYTEFIPLYEDTNTIKSEVVGTSLLNNAMPFIRYRTNDYVSISKSNKQCNCGRVGPIILNIEGRLDDIIITTDGRKIGRISKIFWDTVNIKESQVIQHQNKNLTIKVVRRSEYTKRDEDKLLNNVKGVINDPLINIDVDYVERIPCSKSGKYKFVISEAK